VRALVQFFLVILFLGVTAAFAAVNDDVISINYFVGEGDIRLTYLLLACVIFGSVMSLILMTIHFLKMRLELRRLRKSVTEKSKELSNLRELPVKDPY